MQWGLRGSEKLLCLSVLLSGTDCAARHQHPEDRKIVERLSNPEILDDHFWPSKYRDAICFLMFSKLLSSSCHSQAQGSLEERMSLRSGQLSLGHFELERCLRDIVGCLGFLPRDCILPGQDEGSPCLRRIGGLLEGCLAVSPDPVLDL